MIVAAALIVAGWIASLALFALLIFKCIRDDRKATEWRAERRATTYRLQSATERQIADLERLFHAEPHR